MANQLETTQKKMERALNEALENASEIITKDYLSRLEQYEIIQPSEEDLDIDIAECGKLFRLTKFVINREEKGINNT